jgi:hypothetical protein
MISVLAKSNFMARHDCSYASFVDVVFMSHTLLNPNVLFNWGMCYDNRF